MDFKEALIITKEEMKKERIPFNENSELFKNTKFQKIIIEIAEKLKQRMDKEAGK